MNNKLEKLAHSYAILQGAIPNLSKECMYHYTSPNAMTSILFNKTNNIVLWASRSDCLNDTSEGQIVENVYKEACLDMLNQGEVTKEQYDILSTMKTPSEELFVYEGADNFPMASCRQRDRYIISFSLNADSLSMWNYYSKGNRYEGFNIGFRAQEVLQYLKSQYDLYAARFRMVPVLYNKSEQVNTIKSTLHALLQLHSEDDPALTYRERLKDDISECVSCWELTFKNACFEHEEEVRVIIDIPKHYDENVPPECRIPICHRYDHGCLIPYIEIEINKDALNSVCIGPLQMDEEGKKRQLSIMDEMLRGGGYAPVAAYSNIPVRY